MITAENIADYPFLESIAPSLRNSVKGPEYELVHTYVQSKLPAASSNQLKVTFLEPQVGSSFPDIVIVYFDTKVIASWPKERAKLTKSDIRILHYISTEKTVTLSQIRKFFPSNSSTSLKRLHKAELIESVSDVCSAKPLYEIFAVQRLVAIEAKINCWQQGLQQAFHNSWFASESYLLLQHIPKKTTLFKQAEHFGVGVLMPHQILDEAKIPVQPDRIPKSYASWLFNEWAWRVEAFST